jgi:hypothetical protein
MKLSRKAIVLGTLRCHRSGVPFRGEVELEQRDECVYYTWLLKTSDGEFLGSVSRPVSLRVVPSGEDPMEFALGHAVHGIQQHRFGREHPFEVTSWEWIAAGSSCKPSDLNQDNAVHPVIGQRR